jgi:hypothetical protein
MLAASLLIALSIAVRLSERMHKNAGNIIK